MTQVSSFSRTYACLLVAAFLLVVAVQPAQAGVNIRANRSFFNTSMRLCNPDADGNCDNGAYALSVARFGAGGIAAAALSLLAFVVFLPVRCLCNGFGGKNASYGICPSSSDFRSYTKKESFAVKIAVLVITIPIIIGVAIGFQANSDVSTSIDSITGSLVESGDNITQSLLDAQALLLALPYTSSSAGVITNAVNIAVTIRSNMHSARDTTNNYDKLRESFMIIGFAFSLALVFVGIACAFLNLRLPAFILAMVSLLILTIIWLSFGIHLVADKFVYDVCVDIDILTDNSTANSNTTSVFKTGALADLWKCGGADEFQQLQEIVDQGIIAASAATCALRSTYCFNTTSGQGDPHWICANSPSCGPSTVETVVDQQHLVIIDGLVNRTMRDCAANCVNATLRAMAGSLSTTVSYYTNYTRLYYDAILPLVSCQLATNVMNGFKDALCVTLFDSIYGVAVSNLIVGIFYVAFIILMVVGYKRFTNTSDGGIV